MFIIYGHTEESDREKSVNFGRRCFIWQRESRTRQTFIFRSTGDKGTVYELKRNVEARL